MILRSLLSICSTTDAFIIKTFSTFPMAAKLGALVFGPLFDFKLFWLYSSIFKTPRGHRPGHRALRCHRPHLLAHLGAEYVTLQSSFDILRIPSILDHDERRLPPLAPLRHSRHLERHSPHLLRVGRMRALLTPDFRVGAVIAGIVMGLMALVFLLFPADANCCSSRNADTPFSGGPRARSSPS